MTLAGELSYRRVSVPLTHYHKEEQAPACGGFEGPSL